MCLFIQRPATNAGALRYSEAHMLLKKKKKYRDAVMGLSKVARKNITVFKVLSDCMVSPYRCKRFEYGVTYKSRFGFKAGPRNIHVESGLHSFSASTRARWTISRSGYYYKPRIDRVFEAVIPKGATYFVGIDEEIVSDRLIIKKKIY